MTGHEAARWLDRKAAELRFWAANHPDPAKRARAADLLARLPSIPEET